MIEYTDPETGLIYLRNRYYDPNTAQFLTPDPLFALTGERYGYAGNDPLDGDDPLGLGCGLSLSGLKDCGKAVVNTTVTVATGDQANCVRYVTCSSATESLAHKHKHVRDFLYVTLGASLAVASLGTLAAPELGAFGLTAGTTQTLITFASGGAALGDLGPCRSGDHAACAGFWLALGGAGGGLGALIFGESALGLTLGTFGITGSMLGLILDSINAIDERFLAAAC